MRKIVLPLLFLGLGTFVMAGCGDSPKEKTEGEETQSSQAPQLEEQKTPHSVSKPETSYDPVSAAPQDPQSQPDQSGPVVESPPEAGESNAPSVALPEENSPFESAPAEESTSESPASEQPALEEPSVVGEPAASAENPELPSEGASAGSDGELDPFGGATFEDVPAEDADFPSDPFGPAATAGEPE